MNSLANPGTPRRRLSRGIALGLCLAVALLSSYQTYRFRPPPSEQQIAKAEDEVYEAVVRHMLPDIGNPTSGMRLVFDDKQIIGDFPGGDARSCQRASADWVQVLDEPPPFKTTADKTYRFLTSGLYDTAPGTEVMRDYVKRVCIAGYLSRSFHTDVPRSFIGEEVDFGASLSSIENDSQFARLFPGASGILGFSHVGFNRQLDEAIVSASYVCGGLCGSGHRYYLKKVLGQWKVVSSRMVWVS